MNRGPSVHRESGRRFPPHPVQVAERPVHPFLELNAKIGNRAASRLLAQALQVRLARGGSKIEPAGVAEAMGSAVLSDTSSPQTGDAVQRVRPGRRNGGAAWGVHTVDTHADGLARPLHGRTSPVAGDMLPARGEPRAGTPAPPGVQRKIGFEFEEGRWHPWHVDRGASIGGYPAVKPAPRKEQLHLGTKFRLEADDTPGPHESNIEFVTEPFEETLAGVRELVTALREMREIWRRLCTVTGFKGPRGTIGSTVQGPPWPYDAYDYVTSGTHRLSGSPAVAKDNVALSGGSASGYFKMQATMGLTLGELTRMMAVYGVADPGREDPQLTQRWQQPRSLAQSEGFAVLLGRAPDLAKQVVLRIVRDSTLTGAQATALRDRKKIQDLQGYIALLMLYLKGLQFPDNYEGAKSRVMFLARNKFSDLYTLLDPVLQQLLAAGNGALLKRHLLDVSNENPLIPEMRGQTPDTDLSLGDPLVNPVHRGEIEIVSSVQVGQRKERDAKGKKRKVPVYQEAVSRREAQSNPLQQKMSGFTIGVWLESVALGQDHLTTSAMATWLQNNSTLPKSERDEVSESVLESFGEYGLDVSGPEPLALFENRGLLQDGQSFEAVCQVAFRYLLYAAAVKRHGVAHALYPDSDIPGW